MHDFDPAGFHFQVSFVMKDERSENGRPASFSKKQ